MNAIDDLCDRDSNKKLFSFKIDDFSYDHSKVYDCRIYKTNYASINFQFKRITNFEFEFSLPDSKNQTLFQIDTKPTLIIDLICSNNDILAQRQLLEMKICRTRNKIKDIIIDSNSQELPVIKYDLPAKSFIVKFRAVDKTNKPMDDYMFALSKPSEYFQILANGNVFLKKTLDKKVLKYIEPKLKLYVKVIDKYDSERDIDKVFQFKINSAGQELPPLVFKTATFKTLTPQFTQDGEFYFKIGQFKLNETVYPSSQFNLRLNFDNLTLDNENNLFLSEYILKGLYLTALTDIHEFCE